MRRDPIEIMKQILNLLGERHEAMSINMISEMTGIHNITVKKYIQLIEMVKNEQIEIIKTRRSIIVRIKKDANKHYLTMQNQK
ncbi:MAG: hypothetical protein J7K72_02200 [Candidatus Aenigmarchaeota archaeon]|nr:hypothetical protein [Candidatus Aenigmarchaeota archaeon]